MRLRFPEAWAPPIGRLAQIPRGKSSGGKRIAEHGQPAPRLLAGGLILNPAPVRRQQSVRNASNVENDPFRGQAEATKPAMQHYHVALRHDQTVLIFTLGRDALNQAEEPVAPRWYMGAMLNVVGRPELLCCDEILLIEQGVKRFEDKCLVSLGCKFAHFGSPWFCRQRFSLSAGLLLKLRSDGGSRAGVLRVRGGHVCSVRGQTFSDCSANTAQAAPNQCNLSFQFLRHRFFSHSFNHALFRSSLVCRASS